MQERSYSSSAYKFGFNGKEKDNEINVDGGSYDFGARIYDGRLGRWLSLDPMQEKYPSLNPYNFCAENPIFYNDPDGKRIIIYYLDENGKPQQYVYGCSLKVPDNKFLKQSIEAIDYIIKNDNSNIVKNIVNSDRNDIELSETGDRNAYTMQNFDKSMYDQSGKLTKVTMKVEWNPNMGMINSNGFGMAPSTILFHEIYAHAKPKFDLNSYEELKKYYAEDNKPLPTSGVGDFLNVGMDTREDQNAILKGEPNYIQSCNFNSIISKGPDIRYPQIQGTRNNHREGIPYNTIGVNSTTPSNPIPGSSKSKTLDPNNPSAEVRGVECKKNNSDNLNPVPAKPTYISIGN